MSADVNAILALEIPLIVEIAGRRMPLAETVNLTHGAIIEFPKNADSELRVLINNKAVGAGHAVKVGENFGVRITQLGPVSERVEALAG